MIKLVPCPKSYTTDQDKAVHPADTINRVREKLSEIKLSILSKTQRVDVNRLGIPVFLSVCGSDARAIMPTRKQMGKGASLEQAEASALMELMERYSFFSFFSRLPKVVEATWSEAVQMAAEGKIPPLMDIEEIIRSAHDDIEPEKALAMMDMVRWKFMPLTEILSGRTVTAPLDWFRQLGEFNGSSAGNTDVESILQGSSELIERHVSCIADREHPVMPTIDPKSCTDPALARLIACFEKNNVKLFLKDMSLGQPLPTVAALAYDPESFPMRSEIVFTAGTASSPTKAAIRAITEVAQLAGDFCTGACYEASGLPKYMEHAEYDWLLQGPLVSIDSLPSVETDDIREELLNFCSALKEQSGLNLYSVATTNPQLDIPAHYSIIPGLSFRERDENSCMGLFIGRIICEHSSPDEAERKLDELESIQPGSHYLAFFRALVSMNKGDLAESAQLFAAAEGLQPGDEAKALCAFYAGYSLSQLEELELDAWTQALPYFKRAAHMVPSMKEYWNRLGVCQFKLNSYEEAAAAFGEIICNLDKGSATDLANLGLCFARMGQKEKAVEHLSAALEIDPSLEYARDALERI